MDSVKQFVGDGTSEEPEKSPSFPHQAGIHPSTLEFNFAQQPIIQPSPVQDVISILEKHLANRDKLRQMISKASEQAGSADGGDSRKVESEVNKEVGVEKDTAVSGTKLKGDKTSKSQPEKNSTDSNLKYVVVDQKGAPDWTKVLNLDVNIIKEVWKKHGVNIGELLSSGKSGGQSKSNKEPKEKIKKANKKKKKSKTGEPEKTIPCTLCDKKFHLKRQLQYHMRYHGKRKNKCKDCDYVALRKKDLEYHQHTHTGKRPFVCDICSKSFRHPTVLANHVKSHRGHSTRVTCEICKMEFDLPNELDRHMQTHSEERPHQCDFCENNFKRTMDLRKHILMIHKEEAANIDQIVPKKPAPPEGQFKCRRCLKSFRTNHGLEQHERLSHDRMAGLEEADEMMFSCQQCNRVFPALKLLTKHKLTHLALRPYTCSICGRSYKRQWELHKHKKTHGAKKIVVPCTQCEATFASQLNLTRHMKRMHSEGERTISKPHQCEACLQTYARRTELEEHKNVHTGARPYVCDTCGKSFSFRSSLACHKKLHEEEGAILCDVCGKKFGSKIRMKEHRVMHTGEKPCVCQYCDASYKYPSNLRWHINKVHKGLPGRANKKQQQQESDSSDSEESAITDQPTTAQAEEHLLAPLELGTIHQYQPEGPEGNQTQYQLDGDQIQMEQQYQLEGDQTQTDQQYQLQVDQTEADQQEQEGGGDEQPVMQIHYDTGEVHQLITAPMQYAGTVQVPANVEIQEIETLPIAQQEGLGQQQDPGLMATVAEYILRAPDTTVLQAADGSLIIETPVHQLETGELVTSLNQMDSTSSSSQEEITAPLNMDAADSASS